MLNIFRIYQLTVWKMYNTKSKQKTKKKKWTDLLQRTFTTTNSIVSLLVLLFWLRLFRVLCFHHVVQLLLCCASLKLIQNATAWIRSLISTSSNHIKRKIQSILFSIRLCIQKYLLYKSVTRFENYTSWAINLIDKHAIPNTQTMHNNSKYSNNQIKAKQSQAKKPK